MVSMATSYTCTREPYHEHITARWKRALLAIGTLAFCDYADDAFVSETFQEAQSRHVVSGYYVKAALERTLKKTDATM